MRELRAFLLSSRDEGYAAFQRKLLPGVENIVGVRMPLVRGYVKQALRDGRWENWPEPDADAPYEEMMIRGLILAQADMPFDEHARAMEAFLPRIDNWGVCDGVCSACRFLRDDRARGYRWIMRLLESGAEFTVRFALVCLCDHFAREGDWTARVLEAARTAQCGENYYARVALAWLLAETASADASAVTDFLRGGIDPFVAAFDDMLRDMKNKGEDTH